MGVAGFCGGTAESWDQGLGSKSCQFCKGFSGLPFKKKFDAFNMWMQRQPLGNHCSRNCEEHGNQSSTAISSQLALPFRQPALAFWLFVPFTISDKGFSSKPSLGPDTAHKRGSAAAVLLSVLVACWHLVNCRLAAEPWR